MFFFGYDGSCTVIYKSCTLRLERYTPDTLVILRMPPEAKVKDAKTFTIKVRHQHTNSLCGCCRLNRKTVHSPKCYNHGKTRTVKGE